MFDNLKNLRDLMSQAGQIQEKAQQIQDELAKKTVEAESGAGAVRVKMNGKFEVVDLNLDPTMIRTLASDAADPAEADKQMIEELVVAAIRAAHQKAEAMIKEEMAQATGGLNLPGLEQLLGGS